MTPDALKALRRKLGFTQQALAEQLGVTRNTVTRWEMGRYPIPRIAQRLIRFITSRHRS